MPSALVTSVGLRPFEIVSFVITHLETSLREGSSNITSSSALSMIERSPRAPVSRSSALSAISQSASSVKTSSIVVVPEEALVLLDERVLRLGEDLDEILRRSWCTAETTGRRPMNSGIRPKFDEILRHHLREQLGALLRVPSSAPRRRSRPRSCRCAAR